MKYQTAIEDVEFYAFHGLYPEEKVTGSRFVVSVSVEQEVDDHASMRRLVEVVNYETLFSIVKKEMEKPRDLIETVAKAILDDIGSHIHHVQWAEVKISKPDPAGLFKSGAASARLSKKFA